MKWKSLNNSDDIRSFPLGDS